MPACHALQTAIAVRMMGSYAWSACHHLCLPVTAPSARRFAMLSFAINAHTIAQILVRSANQTMILI
jgi:hypothetical protein